MTISVNRIRDRVEIIHIKKSDQSRNYEQGGKGERRISAGFSNGNGRTFQIQHLLFRPKPRPIGFRCRLCLRFCGKNYQYFFTASNDDKISSRAFFWLCCSVLDRYLFALQNQKRLRNFSSDSNWKEAYVPVITSMISGTHGSEMGWEKPKVKVQLS